MKLKRNEGLNIVPFIDIMLVLLAIVLSISTFIAQGHIPIDIPSSKHSQNPTEKNKLTISIDASNQLYIDSQPITLDTLRDKIAQISPQTLIELQSDKQSRFQSFIDILNILKDNHHENFVITAQKN